MPNRTDETLPKCCVKCGETKVPGQFYQGSTRKDGTRGLTSMCRKCHIERTAEWYRKNLVGQRAYGKEYRKGFIGKPRRRFMAALWQSKQAASKKGYLPCNATPEELEAAHMGKCHVCQMPEIECRTHLHMDHCHKTGAFRGWLCEHCNKAAGHLKESAKVAYSLAEYIERAERKEYGKEKKAQDTFSACRPE